jgi:hypothetical protein
MAPVQTGAFSIATEDWFTAEARRRGDAERKTQNANLVSPLINADQCRSEKKKPVP